ncbi:MAG: rod shape-determining protein MreC [Chthoniobacterales bacterium]
MYALIFLIVLGIAALWRAPLANLFWRTAQPLLVWRDSLQTGEVGQLKAQLASTTLALADRDALYQQNLFLKAQLGRDAAAPTILAGVIMRPPGTPYDTLMVDAGARDGVGLGDGVFAGGTAQIGTVSAVYDTTSRVLLFSSPGSEYQTLLRGSVPLTLVGQGAGSMEGELPLDTPAVVGDSVVLPSIAGGFVGAVSHIDIPPGGSFKTLYVQLPASIFSLQFVEIRQSP